MSTLDNLHILEPCEWCTLRMAVPGTPLCITCDVTLEDVVPDSLEGWL